MNDYSVSGERRLDSAKLIRFKSWFEKAEQSLQRVPEEYREAKRELIERKRRLVEAYPHEVGVVSDFFGIGDPRLLPDDGEFLTALSRLGEFAHGLLSLPITSLDLSNQTSSDIYDLQAPNLTNPRENFYLVAFVGIHKYVSELLGVEPRTGVSGEKWAAENKNSNHTGSFEEVYNRRFKLLTKLGVSPFPAEVPENIDMIMDMLLKDAKFSGVKSHLNKGVDRIFQRDYSEKDSEMYLRYFLTEILFFASQAKDSTLSFHFGTDVEQAWDMVYSSLLIHERGAFEELCQLADVPSRQNHMFSGLSYERPSLYNHRRQRVKPYDPDPSLAPWIPEIGDDNETIRRKLDNAPQENLIILSSGLVYASLDVPDLENALNGMDLYKKLGENLKSGLYPHNDKSIDRVEVSKMLTVASDYLLGGL